MPPTLPSTLYSFFWSERCCFYCYCCGLFFLECVSEGGTVIQQVTLRARHF